MSSSGTTSAAAVDPRHLKVQAHVSISPKIIAQMFTKVLREDPE